MASSAHGHCLNNYMSPAYLYRYYMAIYIHIYICGNIHVYINSETSNTSKANYRCRHVRVSDLDTDFGDHVPFSSWPMRWPTRSHGNSVIKW